MDFSSIATGVFTFLSPYLAKGGEEVFKGVGADLWKLVKKVFSSEKDKKVLDDYSRDPANDKTVGKVEYVLEEKLESDESFRKDILALIEKIPELKSGINITINQRHTGRGDNVGRDKNVNK